MKYRILVEFISDRKLTDNEIDDLTDSISLQVYEPTDHIGANHDYITSQIEISLEGGAN